jgi:hypothetical protein
MKHALRLLAALLLAPLAASHAAETSLPTIRTDVLRQVDAFDVVFDSASKDEADSIPMGNGTTGINLWVEENGDLLFYISSNDALSEMHRLMKLGRVRVALVPNPFVTGKSYRQRLHLRDGCCEIMAGDVRLKVFVDGESQTIYLVGASDQPVQVKAMLENWRDRRRDLGIANGEIRSTHIYRGGPPKSVQIENWESADVVLDRPKELLWYHRNAHSPVPLHLERQGLQSLSAVVPDTIKNRTFGAEIFGQGFVASGPKTLLLEKPSQRFELRVATHIAKTDTAEAFVGQLEAQAKASVGAQEAEVRTAQWWNQYWNRSWILLSGNEPEPPAEKGKKPTVSPTRITQAYVLHKYQAACQSRGELPAYFGGGIFTVHTRFYGNRAAKSPEEYTPDFTAFGGNLWWQNTRLLYQFQLAQGNFDFMTPLFHFYFQHRPVFEGQARLIYGADGLYINECVARFGLPGMADFGWSAREYGNPYTRDIWQDALELGAMALDYYDYTNDAQFLVQTVQWCDQALKFFDTRFKKDDHGRIVIRPTHAVETYWKNVVNDMPSVAGLHEITERLLALPEHLTAAADRANWKRIAKSLPPIPKTKNKDGLAVLDVAEKYDPVRSNYEAPELYCVYPFRIYGLGQTTHDIEEARRAYYAMRSPGHTCWMQTGLFAARLGLTAEAKRDIELRARPETVLRVRIDPKANRYCRFPGFWGSPYDYCPDYDGPGNMANTLQEMLLQPAPNGRLLLLPAWPKEWDVNFKLHAPGNTTVEGIYHAGKLEQLTVTPESRKRDVVISL